MNLPDEKQLKEFDKWHKARPTLEQHGVQDTFDNPLSGQLLEAHPRNWRMEGNLLACDTDFGPLRQHISTDWICLGTDDKGLPILKKVV